MIWLLRIFAFFLLLISVLPLIPTGKWYVRWWDFPRLQIAILLLTLVVIILCLTLRGGFQREYTIWLVLLTTGLVWQGSHIIRFSKLWPTEVDSISEDQTGIKIVVSNLDYENKTPDSVAGELAAEEADVLLLVEYHDGWVPRLEKLKEVYPYRHDEVRGEGLGMAVWSKIPFASAKTRHLISDRRASLWVQLDLDSGKHVNFVGVHPNASRVVGLYGGYSPRQSSP